MKSTALLQAGVLALTCSFLATNASAAIINVDNWSFETLPVGGLPFPCGTDCFFGGADIPGWTTTGIATGQFQPGPPATTTYFDSLSDGATSAFTNGGTITQTVFPTVVEGVTYTLLIDLGARKDASPAGIAALVINGIQYIATGLFLPGSFTTFSVSYVGTLADAGQAIQIELSAPGGAQGNFDNVRLSDDTVAPEPGTMMLMGLGLTVLGVLRRKYTA